MQNLVEVNKLKVKCKTSFKTLITNKQLLKI